jgi:hypothetical protein
MYAHEPWARKYPKGFSVSNGRCDMREEFKIILFEGFSLGEGFGNIKQSDIPRSGTKNTNYGGNFPFNVRWYRPPHPACTPEK